MVSRFSLTYQSLHVHCMKFSDNVHKKYNITKNKRRGHLKYTLDNEKVEPGHCSNLLNRRGTSLLNVN